MNQKLNSRSHYETAACWHGRNPFPLTPALSPRRGSRHDRLTQCRDHRIAGPTNDNSPSPRGEGWGEGERIVHTGVPLRFWGQFPRLGFIAGILWLVLVSTVAAFAQETTPPSNNPAADAAALILSNAMSQIGEFVAPIDMASNGVSQEEVSGQTNGYDTNAPAQGEGRSPGGPRESRRQWLLRQRAGAPGPDGDAQNGDRSSTNGAGFPDRGPVKPDYSAFKLITEKNIFDPNRVRRGPGFVRQQTKNFDSFALVGVMSYEKGTFAFFDGTSSDYKKALKLSDSIAGYKVTDINSSTVKLAAGTNRVELHVGMQMRREQDGDWVASTQAETYAASSSSVSGGASGSTPAVTAGGSDNDVLERLRKKREQE